MEEILYSVYKHLGVLSRVRGSYLLGGDKPNSNNLKHLWALYQHNRILGLLHKLWVIKKKELDHLRGSKLHRGAS